MLLTKRLSWLGVGALGLLIACGAPAQSGAPSRSGEWFSDVTATLGPHFVHKVGGPDAYFMPKIVGSGGGLIDFDNDGRLDVYLVQNSPIEHATNRLYHQEAGGTFRDVSQGSGLDVSGYGMGVAVGDVNNDGWPDLLLTEYGRLRLFVNNHNGTFADVAAAADLHSTEWSTSATFLDFDRDGWLDLVVANYVKYVKKRCRLDKEHDDVTDFCGPNAFRGGTTRLYRNLGGRAAPQGAVRFEDVTARAGLERDGSALGVVAADFTGDRWPDILVANDGMSNYLWINRHDGTFSEEAIARGIAFDAKGHELANMGIAIGDVNSDGLFDIFMTHITEELHNGWMQGPAGTFQDRTGAMGLGRPKWRSTGWGAVFGDFDQDGAVDLAWVNAKVKVESADAKKRYKPKDGFWAPYFDRNQVFSNDGTGHFTDISDVNQSFSSPPGMSRGLMMGDIDGDGALDLLVANTDAPARLFRNVARDRGHWLKIRTILPELGGRDAYGAEVTVRAGSRSWKRIVNPGFSYCVSNAPDVHVGLGGVDRVDVIAVVWPDGTDEQFPGGPVDRALVLKKGTSVRVR